MTFNKLTLILFLLLAASGAVNAVLYNFSIENYRSKKLMQVDPSGSFNHAGSRDAAPPRGSTRIVFFGDSRISQWAPMPDLPGCELLKRGVPGETSAQSLLRVDRDVMGLKPDIAVIQVGVNDCNAIGVLPDLRDAIMAGCKDNIDALISRMKQRGIRTVVLTIFPAGTPSPLRRPIWSEWTRKAIAEVNGHLLKNNARAAVVIDCDALLLGKDERIKSAYAADLLHLSSAGYCALNTRLHPILARMAKEPATRK